MLSSVLIAVMIALQAIVEPLPSPIVFQGLTVPERKAVMNRVAAMMASAPEPTYGLIAVGLADPDQGVRLVAGSAVRRLADQVLLAAVDVRHARRISVTQALADAFSNALDASEAGVREPASNALFLLDPDRAHLQQQLTRRYGLEPVPALRGELLAHLRLYYGNDPAVQALALAALDEATPELRYEAAMTARLLTPDSVLPKVAAGVQDQPEALRVAFLQALGAYRVRAALYVPMLQDLLVTETRPRVRAQIQATIAAITPQSPTPTPTPTPSPTPSPTPAPTPSPTPSPTPAPSPTAAPPGGPGIGSRPGSPLPRPGVPGGR